MHSIGATLTERSLADSDFTDQLANSTLETHHRTVIALVGMAFEAKIAAGPGVLVVCRNSRRELASVAKSAARQGYRGIISFGVAGGLNSSLRTGDWVVASTVLKSQIARATDAAWSKRLLNVISGACHAPIIGVDAPVAEPTVKRELHRTTGAAAVDMRISCRGAARRRPRPRLRRGAGHHRPCPSPCPFGRAPRHGGGRTRRHMGCAARPCGASDAAIPLDPHRHRCIRRARRTASRPAAARSAFRVRGFSLIEPGGPPRQRRACCLRGISIKLTCGNRFGLPR